MYETARFSEYWSSMLKINNVSLLEQYLHDEHLRKHSLKLRDADLKLFEHYIEDYIIAEKYNAEELLDKTITRFCNLFLRTRTDIMGRMLQTQRTALDPKYRDHNKHQLGVCFLADYLLESDVDLLTLARTKEFYHWNQSEKAKYPGLGAWEYFPEGEILPKQLPSAYEFKNLFLDVYVFLLLFHDWGYIYQLEDQYNEKIRREIYHIFNLDEFRNNEKTKGVLETILSKMDITSNERRTLVSFLYERLNDDEIKDHGVISALILFSKFGKELLSFKPKLPSNVNRPPADREEEVRKKFLYDALAAIAMHESPLHEKNIKLRIGQNVYYFILVLCDLISDWGRKYKLLRSAIATEILQDVYLGYWPKDLRKGRGVVINVLISYRNKQHLLRDLDFNEVDEFYYEKPKTLQSLDFTNLDGEQWLDLRIVLIDRFGRRFMIRNDEPVGEVKFFEIENKYQLQILT